MATTTLLLLILAMFFLFHLSSSREESSSTQLLLQLTHRLSNSESSTHNLLKSSSLRSSTRFRTRQHRNQNKHNQQQQVSVPLSAGSDYTLTLSLSKNNSVTLYMDTGSDLVWFPCSPFQCMLCEGKTPSELTTDTITTQTPTNSKPVHCSDPSCSAAHSSLPSSDLCAISGCPLDALETSTCPSESRCPRFYYAYGDGSLIATLRRGPVHLANSHPVSLPNFTFACAHSALAEPVGVAGFGRGLLSLPNQLSPSSLGSRFSYCLLSHSFRSQRLLQPSPLILGRSSASLTDFVYTPILPNPKHSYLYSVGLAAISVGPVMIPADSNLMAVDSNGDGGLAVDSGTTFTMLPTKLYSKLVSEFGKQMKRAGFAERAEEAESETGLSPCYYYSGSRNESSKVPSMSLHFIGNGNSSSSAVELPRRNYFLGFESGSKKKRRVGCLMVMDGGDDDTTTGGGPAGTLGNFQQQGFEVVYDLEEDRVGFARRRCSALWDQMSRD